jgi:DNA repair exonuclease SbcCD nuclease subunit
MNRTFVTGDTHFNIHITKLFTLKHKVGKMDKTDVVIIAGDAGFKWYNNPNNCEENKLNRKIDNLPFSVFVVLGNHENYNRIEELPTIKQYGARVKIDPRYPSIVYAKRGEVYTINGKTFFCFGGAPSVDKTDRKENISWWAQEVPSSEDIYKAHEKLEEYNYQFDYVITHDAPPMCINVLGYSKDHESLEHASEFYDFLTYLWINADFKQWYCGHYHEDNNNQGRISFLFQSIVEIENNSEEKIQEDYSRLFDKI